MLATTIKVEFYYAFNIYNEKIVRKNNNVWYTWFFFFFFNLKDISTFCEANDAPDLDFRWCLLWVSKSGQPYLCLAETYMLHVSRDSLPVQHLLMTSIVAKTRQAGALLIELCRPGYTWFFARLLVMCFRLNRYIFLDITNILLNYTAIPLNKLR